MHCGTAEGLTSWDLSTGEEHPLRRGASEIYPGGFNKAGGLIEVGEAEVSVWPLTLSPATARYGPPQRVRAPGVYYPLACTPDGRIAVVPQFDEGAVLVKPDHPGEEVRLGPKPDVRYCAVSSDGRLVALGSHSGRGSTATVWTSEGREVAEMPVGGPSKVGFSPDGRWLATTAEGCRLWDVGSWRPGPVLGGESILFTPDSGLMALNGENGVVQLVRISDGRKYVQFAPSDGLASKAECFSPDGALLVVYGQASHLMYVWDLRLVRARLAEMGLDWDLPPYPPKTADAGPERLELVGKP